MMYTPINMIASVMGLNWPLVQFVTIHRKSWRKPLQLAGYNKADLEKEFGGMLKRCDTARRRTAAWLLVWTASSMLLADEPNLREVYAFVMNGQYEDQMMNAPSPSIERIQLKDLHIKLDLPKPKNRGSVIYFRTSL